MMHVCLFKDWEEQESFPCLFKFLFKILGHMASVESKPALAFNISQSKNTKDPCMKNIMSFGPLTQHDMRYFLHLYLHFKPSPHLGLKLCYSILKMLQIMWNK